MILLAGSSILIREELEKRAKGAQILLLNPKKITSEEELLLAERLTKDSINEKRSLAKKEEMEFLLWISAKTNILSALKEYGFKSPKELLIISFQKGRAKAQLTKEFKLTETKPEFKKSATAQEIERISLSRV